MAIQPTRRFGLVSSYPNGFDNKETRFSETQALNAFIDDQNSGSLILNPDTVEKYKQSYFIEKDGGAKVQIPVFNNLAVTLNTTGMVCDNVVAENADTALYDTATSVYIGFEFKEPALAASASNRMTPNQVFNNAVMRGFAEVNQELNTLCIAKLTADNNQLFPAEILQYYNEVAGVFQVPLADQEEMFNTIPSIHDEMNFPEAMRIIGGINLAPKIRHWSNQGVSNDENLRYQFLQGNKKFYLGNSSALSDPAGKKFFAVSDGTLGIASRVAPNYINPALNGSDPRKERSLIKNPFNDFEFGWETSFECASDGTFNYDTVTHKIGAEFLIETAYNSDIANKFQPITTYLALNV